MKKRVLALILCIPFCANAAGDITAGKEKAAVCTACHGEKGVSNNPEWPNLAGQHADYLMKQLMDYKKGKTRNNASMTPVVAGLSKQDMADLSAYYASLPLPKGATPKKYVSRGEQLYRGGDISQHITACIACHGPRGLGNAQAGFPVLSAQHALYTVTTLKQFKNNERTNDLNQIMQDITSRMSTEDMEAVAYYMQGLH